MTVAIQTRRRATNRRSPIAERRRQALEQARGSRNKSTRRSRYVERVSKDPKPLGFYVIAVVTLTLVLFGLVMVLSSSSIVSFHRGRSPWFFFSKQAIYAVVGAVALFMAYRMPLDKLRLIARTLPFFGLGFMAMSFLPGIGTSVNGARAWVHIGDYNIQPAEFMKLILIVYGADLLARREKSIHDFTQALRPYLTVVAIAAGIAIVQSDIGSCVVLSLIGVSMLFLAGAPLKPMFLAALGAVCLGALYVAQDPDKLSRITSFLDIHGTRESDGYQVYQALISLSNGGLTGTGIGAGTGKWGYVPIAHSDFIFSIVGEEMGLLGVLGLMTLFAFLIYFAFQVALSCRHRFGFLVAAGIGCWMTVQVSINIGGVIGIMPVTGLTLPFISFGGSSLIASMAAAGLLMNVARRPR